MNGAACPFVERPAQLRIFLHFPHDTRAAAVGPGLHVHKRFLFVVQTGEAVHDRAQGYACQLLVLVAELVRRLAHDLFDSFINLQRTFFRPVRMRRQQRIKRFGRADVRPFFRVGDSPYACRPYVDANPNFLICRIHWHMSSRPFNTFPFVM